MISPLRSPWPRPTAAPPSLPLLLASLSLLPALAPSRGAGAQAREASPDLELIDRIVVLVNDDLILDSEIREEMAAYIAADPSAVPQGPGREEALAELRDVVIEGLVGRKLSDQAVARLGIVVEDSEVEAQVAETARLNDMTVEQLERELARQGIPMDEFRSDIRDQIKQFRLFQAEIGTKIDIDEELLRQRYNERYANAPADPEYHLRVLVLHVPEGATPEEAAAVRQRAAELRAQALAGGDFEELARQHSEDPSGANGGNFGKLKLRSMIPEFRGAVDGLAVGDVSEPVEFRGAVWLIQVTRITDASVRSFEEMRDALFEELYQEEEERQISLWLERERARAHIEYVH